MASPTLEALHAQLSSLLARASAPRPGGVCVELERFAATYRAEAPRRAPVHPLLAKHVTNHGLGAVRRSEDGGRLASLANTSRIFHMTHIAKTGGRSVRAELLRLVHPVGGAEQCYPPFVHPTRVNIIFFREPRAHVVSQYLHGATVGSVGRKGPNAKWLRRRDAGYPMGDGDGGQAGGLARWAAHFAHGWTPARGDFFSYNPSNMMGRALSCRNEEWNCDYVRSCEAPCAHHVGNDAADATPPLGVALGGVHAADVVGVLELLSESLCVVEYRVRRRLSEECFCADDGGGGGGGAGGAAGGASGGGGAGGGGGGGGGGGKRRGRVHVRNPGQRKAARLSTASLPEATLRDIDAITTVDAQVFRSAVLRLLCDIRAVEAATGRTVLCPARLAELRRKTAHIDGLWGVGASANVTTTAGAAVN